MADEPPASSNNPIKTKITRTGASHHFLRCFRNSKKSLIDSILLLKNTD